MKWIGNFGMEFGPFSDVKLRDIDRVYGFCEEMCRCLLLKYIDFISI